MHNLSVLIIGVFFGFVLVRGEVISWFRIQEMFRFQDFHMYGIIGSAIAVAAVSLMLIRSLGIRSIDGSEIRLEPKKVHKGNVFGGVLFGIGWALTGACPGPLYALIGSGFGVILIPLASALVGTWAYGLLRERLPH